jgi:hypothetical protein
MSLRNWFYLPIRGTIQRLTRNKRTRPISSRNPYRPRLETLEDRLAPAVNITVIPGAWGVGKLDHLLTAGDGTITASMDPGDRGATLSVGALERVGPEIDISITAVNSITFRNIGMLALQTDAGVDATFTANNGALTFANAGNTIATWGGSLNFNAGTNLTVGKINTNGGDVTLTAGTAAGGSVFFSNIRTSGSGNINLQATNPAGGNITQGGGAAIAAGLAITASATNNVVVNALRGTTVDLNSNNGSVDSGSARRVQASNQLSISAATGINLNTLAAALSATNSSSGDIMITQSVSPRQSLRVDGAGDGVVNGASTGQIFLTNLGGGIAVDSGVGIATNNGDIHLAANGFAFAGSVDSGIASTNLSNSIAGRQFDLGSHVFGKIGLTQADLDNVTAAVLRIGSPSSGTINVSAGISASSGWNVLTLIGGNSVTEAAAGFLSLPDLRISAVGPVNLSSVNNVGVVASDTTNAFTFNNGTHTLTVGVVDGDAGIVTNGSNVHVIADNMNVTQQITTGSNAAGIVNLEPFTLTQTIDLGTNSPGNLGLTNAELNEITAGVLRIGSSSFGGNIQVSAAISPANVGALSLFTTSTGTISQGALDTITVASGNGALAIQAQTAVSLTEANDVATLSALIGGSSNNFTFTNIKLTVKTATVDGVTGITASGTVTIND